MLHYEWYYSFKNIMHDVRWQSLRHIKRFQRTRAAFTRYAVNAAKTWVLLNQLDVTIMCLLISNAEVLFMPPFINFCFRCQTVTADRPRWKTFPKATNLMASQIVPAHEQKRPLLYFAIQFNANFFKCLEILNDWPDNFMQRVLGYKGAFYKKD